jgi:hypothetical protein
VRVLWSATLSAAIPRLLEPDGDRLSAEMIVIGGNG